MNPQTNGANTETWLEASKEVMVRAYVTNYVPTLSVRENPVPSAGLYDALREASVQVLMQRAVTLEPQLEMELLAWDVLSDEALRDFEQGLE